MCYGNLLDRLQNSTQVLKIHLQALHMYVANKLKRAFEASIGAYTSPYDYVFLLEDKLTEIT